MSKNDKAKRNQQRKLDQRVVAGVLVGAVILVVLVAKLSTDKASVPVSAASPSGTPAATGASSGSQPTSGVVLGPALPSPAPTRILIGEMEFASPTEQLKWVVSNNKPAMVLYHSTNCIPCKAMDELMQQVRGDYEPDVVFVDVIIGESANAQLVKDAAIRYIPTTHFYTSVGTSDVVVGAMKELDLRAVLDKLKAGD